MSAGMKMYLRAMILIVGLFIALSGISGAYFGLSRYLALAPIGLILMSASIGWWWKDYKGYRE